MLGTRRSGVRVWRRTEEATKKSCIRARQKGYSEFIFQGSVCQYKKGPYHTQQLETITKKKNAKKDLNEINQLLKPAAREQQELETGMRRLRLRNMLGKKLEQKFTKKNGALARDNKGGINQYRYQKIVMIPKLIPFAKRIERKYGRQFII